MAQSVKCILYKDVSLVPSNHTKRQAWQRMSMSPELGKEARVSIPHPRGTQAPQEKGAYLRVLTKHTFDCYFAMDIG